MKKTSLRQKLLLVIFGVVLSAVFLEISLRMAGIVVLYLQERRNHSSFQHNEYRILAVGESTTALGGEDSYPSQLEEMLNTQSRRMKFTVINKGVISTTSNYILAHMDQNLDTYKPQLVIVMMGINDRVYLHDFSKVLWWENVKSYLKDFRVYKLVCLIHERIIHRIKEVKNGTSQQVDLNSDEEGNYPRTENFLKFLIAESVQRFSGHRAASIQYQSMGQLPRAQFEKKLSQGALDEGCLACIELARRYRFQGLFQQSQDTLEKAMIFNPQNPVVFKEWGYFYLAQKKSTQAVQAFQTAFALDQKDSEALLGVAHAYHQAHDNKAFLFYAGYLQMNPKDYWGYIEVARWFRENKKYDMAQEYLNHALKLDPDHDQAYVDLGETLGDQEKYKQEEAFYLKGISSCSKSSLLYQALGEFYHKHSKENLSKEYFQKAAQNQMTEYCPATLVNYNLLLDKILKRHIKVIVMQYPLRDIDPLENYLGQRQEVFFVENKQNFKQALSTETYNYYFKDNFAYNFGHCTRAGNELIARNLAAVINNLNPD